MSTVGATIDAVRRLDDAFDRRDLEGVMAAVAERCTWIIDTPSGRRQASGAAAVREIVERLFTSVGVFTADEMHVIPGQAVVNWRHRARGRSENGMDVISVENGCVARVRTVLADSSTLLDAFSGAGYVNDPGRVVMSESQVLDEPHGDR